MNPLAAYWVAQLEGPNGYLAVQAFNRAGVGPDYIYPEHSISATLGSAGLEVLGFTLCYIKGESKKVRYWVGPVGNTRLPWVPVVPQPA